MKIKTKIKTNELNGAALDWAVAEAEGDVRLQYDSREGLIINNVLGWFPYRPSAAWQQGGPIIEREGISVWLFDDVTWKAEKPLLGVDCVYEAPTPLIAAMRCYVASELGHEVEVPNELLHGESK